MATKKSGQGNRSHRTHRRHPSISDDDDDDTASEIKQLKQDNHGDSGRRRSLGDDSDDERSEEIRCLQKRGILPQDFPAGLNKYDDDDINREILELINRGAISIDEADNIRDNQRKQKIPVTVAENSAEHSADEKKSDVGNNLLIPPYDGDGIPVNWTRDTPERSRYALIELNKRDPTYVDIGKEFEAADISVSKIERLQNLHMLEKFKVEVDQMRKRDRSQTFNHNVRYLYHGTNVMKDRICEEGLDQRLSRMGYFGKGIYFSDNPIKCVHYSADDSTGPNEAYILKCRVILGDSKVLQDLLDSNFDRVATASFGSGGVNQIKFKTFEGSNVVDIREYYISPAGEHKPSKNGVMFNAEFLCDVFDKIKHLLGFCNK